MVTTYTGIPDVDYPANGQDFFDWLFKAGMKNKTLDVVAYLYRHADPEDGIIIATYKTIQKATGTTAPTVAGVMKKLQAGGVLKKVQNGVWQLTPDSYEEGHPYAFIRHEPNPTRL